MAVQQLFTSRIRTANSSSYIGENGRMFYDEALGELRLSNGVTPGGTPITVVANVITTGSLLPTADNQYSIGTSLLRWNHLHLDSAADSIYFSANTLGIDSQGSLSYNSGTGNVAFGNITFHDNSVQSTAFTPTALYTNLVPATGNVYSLGTSILRWGNIYIGPYSIHMADQTTGNDIELTVNNGTLYLNGAQNLAVGNLVIVDTTLTSGNPTLPINIGETGDTGTFYIKRKAEHNDTTFGPTEAMLSLNASGTTHPDTIFPDTLVQAISRPDKNSRIVQRAYGSVNSTGGNNSYAVWAAYAARGNVASPQAIKQNDILSRISSNGYGTTTWGTGGTRIESVALENFTDSAKGSKINFWTTPAGSTTSQQVASITSTGIAANSITFSTDSTTQTTAGIPLTQFAVANGVATLGVDGRLSSAQIPSSLVGAIVFQGGWDAANNTPTLSDGTGTTGYQYIVTIGGTRNLGHGSEVYAAGDTVTYGGNIWNHVQATAPVSSVTGNAHMNISPTVGAITVGIDATPNNTAGTVVSRDSSGNFQANTITASLSGQATSALTAATVTVGAQTNITSVGTLTSLAVSGNVTTGNVSGTNGVFTRVAGTLTTATQPNITTVGTLGSLTVTGNVTAGNVLVGSMVLANNNIYSSATASDITIGQLTATANVVINRTSVFNKDATVNGNVSVTGNITASNVNATLYGNVVGSSSNLKVNSTSTAGTFLSGKFTIAVNVGKNSLNTLTQTITGLTTNHKVIITPATAMVDNVSFFGAAWASGSNTLSIQFSAGGGAVNTSFDINYFAWA